MTCSSHSAAAADVREGDVVVLVAAVGLFLDRLLEPRVSAALETAAAAAAECPVAVEDGDSGEDEAGREEEHLAVGGEQGPARVNSVWK